MSRMQNDVHQLESQKRELHAQINEINMKHGSNNQEASQVMNELIQKNAQLESELSHLRNYRKDTHYQGNSTGVHHHDGYHQPHPMQRNYDCQSGAYREEDGRHPTHYTRC